MTKQVMITLRQIRDNYPPTKLWEKLLKVKGSTEVDFDKPFPLSEILDVGGLEDTIGCFYSLPEHKDVFVKFALFSAKSANVLTSDERVRTCITAVEQYMKGNLSAEEVTTAIEHAQDSTYLGAQAIIQIAMYVLAPPRDVGNITYASYTMCVAHAVRIAASVAYNTRKYIPNPHAYDAPSFTCDTLDADTARSHEVQKQVDYLRTLLDGEVYHKPEIHKLHLKSWLWSLITKPFKKWKNKV